MLADKIRAIAASGAEFCTATDSSCLMQIAGALSRLAEPPLLVFVTGYSEYAMTAFEHDALDYLPKPVAADRLAQSLTRARKRLAERPARGILARPVTELPVGKTTRRLPVRANYAVRLIRVEEIVCGIAREKRVLIRTAQEEHRSQYTLTQLEGLLPPSFLRVHDSAIINLDKTEEILFLGNHTYAVRLTEGLQVPVGRGRYAELQRRLGLDAEPKS